MVKIEFSCILWLIYFSHYIRNANAIDLLALCFYFWLNDEKKNVP